MKKTILQILIGLLILSCSTTKNVETKIADVNNESQNYYSGNINAEQLNFIKLNYNWNDEEILIINYKQPISYCHFNNNKITDSGIKWWKDFYSKINTENYLNIQVLANGERVRSWLDNVNYFDDKNNFLLENFFSRKKTCFGVLIVNNEGNYIQYNGHYSEIQVTLIIENLKI